MNVLDAGQLACIVSVFEAGACACTANPKHSSAPESATRVIPKRDVGIVPPPEWSGHSNI
jgi:hypothetical protein